MAKVKIDLDRTLGSVDPRIFGGFIEHLGRCIYGGIYDEGSPLSNERGFRQDVLAALRPLRVPVLRWPGGNFASAYHWTDGIGPLDDRPRRLNLAWDTEESNRFGTDEFMAYCEALDTEPYLCVNMGTGSIDEAQAWVEYCNGTGDTYWTNCRRRNGHPEPYHVKYWGLGNEMYGSWQIGALSAEDYAKRAKEFAKVMRRTDPNIQLVSCGENGWSEWDRIVLEELAALVDFHSIHIYTGSDDYARDVLEPLQAERALHICQALIDRVRYRQQIAHPIAVAYDEWNVWFRARDTQLGERYTLADALAVATYLNVFIRNCRTVRMANLAQMVNVIAPIVTNPDGLFFQTIYHPLRLYAERIGSVALDVYVDSEPFDLSPEDGLPPRAHRVADLGPFQVLDVAATCDDSRRQVTIAVVNRDPNREIATSIELTGGPSLTRLVAHEVNGADVTTQNSFEIPDAVTASERSIRVSGQELTYRFPPHSLTVLTTTE